MLHLKRLNLLRETATKDETWPLVSSLLSWNMISGMIIGCAVLINNYVKDPNTSTTLEPQQSRVSTTFVCTCPYDCRLLAFGAAIKAANPALQQPLVVPFGQEHILELETTSPQDFVAVAANSVFRDTLGSLYSGYCLDPSHVYPYQSLANNPNVTIIGAHCVPTA
jgi:hypothetical protein